MALIPRPWRAYRRARGAFRVFNALRKRIKSRRLQKRLAKRLSKKEGEEMILNGKLTYTGLGIVAAGLVMNVLGIGDCLPGPDGVCENAQQLADAVIQAGDKILEGFGTLIGIYGRIRAQRKIAALGG